MFGRRVVLLNCLAPGFDAPSAVPDELEAGRDAARALLAAGHTKGIWSIGGHQAVPATPEGIITGNERMGSLEEVLRAGGACLDCVVECDWNTRDGYREVSALLAAGHRPRALVCMTDRVSFGAYQALGEAGRSMPGDVSVVSFDDQDIASVLRPALTTLKLPHYQLGRLAVELILGEGPLQAVVHRVPMLLRERASAPPRPADPGTRKTVVPPPGAKTPGRRDDHQEQQPSQPVARADPARPVSVRGRVLLPLSAVGRAAGSLTLSKMGWLTGCVAREGIDRLDTGSQKVRSATVTRWVASNAARSLSAGIRAAGASRMCSAGTLGSARQIRV
ncbi:substrate-binding domain-containing protein [Streptomyces luteogriseus]|uniref:substrate-binding domain-containing protein n=1 Tax=Streptomyces luteogriseus TaxID=68233 RepID=UPI00379EB185